MTPKIEVEATKPLRGEQELAIYVDGVQHFCNTAYIEDPADDLRPIAATITEALAAHAALPKAADGGVLYPGREVWVLVCNEWVHTQVLQINLRRKNTAMIDYAPCGEYVWVALSDIRTTPPKGEEA